ncbi:MAG: AMP-binding protein [Rhodocyclaceae bacterium]|nr:AMP-binding protein [Rhodocyclaceae bacterium]
MNMRSRNEPLPCLDDPQMLIPDVLESHGKYFRTKEAVVCGSVRRTWGDFNRNINRVANTLLKLGVGKNAKVAVLMGNSVEMLEILFGIVKAGACAVPLSGLLTGEQLADLVNDSGSTLLFATAEFRAKLMPASARLKGVAAERRVAVLTPEAGWTDYAAFVAEASDERPAVAYSPADDFNIIYSSGTTGLPKGIVQTHRARVHWAVSNALEMGITARSRGMTTTSLYSNGTWLIMLPVLFAGGTLVVMPSFATRDFLDTVAHERITHTFMVPTQFVMLLGEGNVGQYDTSSLEVMLSAGSPLRPATKFEAIRQFGDKLIELYGFSEGFATMLKPPHHPHKPDSVGTPVIGFEMKIIDDAGNVLPPGQIGEIAGYGAGMMKEYHGRPQATAELIWRDEIGRTFIRSGDIGVVDADGFLKIVDRKKDMIISGGFNVFASDIEQVIVQHPAVADVAVIGVPHPKWGETPLAIVSRKPAANDSDEEIVAWANERLAKHQRIAGVEFLDEFPRNALGKVLKRILRETFANSKDTSSKA